MSRRTTQGAIAAILGGMFAFSAIPVAAINLATVEMKVDQARAKYGYTGRGVAVAIFDRGIDWTHADFRNADGTTRIAYILDVTDDTGAAQNPYGIGTLYTRAQINAALTGGVPLATRDAVGHGTTTAGYCCANGLSAAGGKYKGIAPEATLLIVKFTTEGAPAHDSEAAEAPYYQPLRFAAAAKFATDKAAELGMPLVIVPNFGTLFDIADGQGYWAKQFDMLLAASTPGRVIVNGPGDDGGQPNHAAGQIAAGATAFVDIDKGATGNLTFQLWYDANDRFDITITTPTGTFGPYVSPATGARNTQTTSDFTYSHDGSGTGRVGGTQRFVDLRINGPTGRYTVAIRAVTTANGNWEALLNPSQYWNASIANRFVNYVVSGHSLWEGASAFNTVVPGTYMDRTSWTSIENAPVVVTGENPVGDIWKGSGIGPTVDGRLGVDASAPGHNAVSTYSPTSYWATFRSNVIQDGQGLYGIAGGGSATNPMIAGVVALMLQAKPDLDSATVKRILQQSARKDATTGAAANATWGNGKVDALAALDAVAALATTPPPPTTVTVAEYYNAVLDHYFITWLPAEQANLDAGLTPTRWNRTGATFKAYATAQAATSPVCRFYLPPQYGDSHFFGRGTVECNQTAQKFPGFIIEDLTFMQMFLPVAGVCPAGTIPVYRVFSNRADANHRYMTDRGTRDLMVARGWLAEGDGPDLVVMCAPS
jgi:minor extracellular serine protease Vpr